MPTKAIPAQSSPFRLRHQLAPKDAPTNDLATRMLEVLPRVRRFVHRLSRGEPGLPVDDVVQSAFERCLRYQDAFDPAQGRLQAWMMKTAYRTWLDQRSQQRRQPRVGLSADAEVECDDTARLVEIREEVAVLLAKLDPRERDVIERFHVRGQSIGEISRALNLAEGTTKSLLHRARHRMARNSEVGR